jgi:hypothetical protein
MLTPNDEIHLLLKNAHPKIQHYVIQLETDNMALKARVAAFQQYVDESLLSREEPEKSEMQKAIEAAQGKVLRPKAYEDE